MDGLDEHAAARARSADSLGHVLVAAALLLALLAVGLFTTPDERGFGTHEQLGLPGCVTRAWFDVPCPGCGVTTSIALAALGRPWDALLNQPLGFAIAFLVPLYAAWTFHTFARGRAVGDELARLRPARAAFWVAALVLLAWAWKIYSS